MFVIGLVEYRKTKGTLDYYLAGKQLGVFLVSFSFFATYFSTAAFLGGGGFGYIAGFQWSAFLTFFHILFAILAWILIAPKLKEIADKHGVLTIPEIFGAKYGEAARVISAFTIIVFFSFYMVSIYKGAGNLLQVMMNISYAEGLIITALIVVFYTALGGFRAVVVTDLIQGILTFLGGVALFTTLMVTLGGLEAIEKLKAAETFAGSGELLFEIGKLAPPPVMKAGMVLPFILSLTFAISIAQLSSPQLVVRFVAARDQRVIHKGMLLTPIIVGIFAICVFSIGPFAWLIIPKEESLKFLKNPDLIVPYIAMKLFPAGINALLLTAIIAAAMSTINSLLHMMATSFARDIIKKDSLVLTRALVVLFALIPLIIAVNPPDVIVAIVGVSFSVITATFLVPLLAALYLNSKPRSVVLAMVSALITSVAWYMLFYRVYWIYPVIPGLIASAVVFVLSEKI